MNRENLWQALSKRSGGGSLLLRELQLRSNKTWKQLLIQQVVSMARRRQLPLPTPPSTRPTPDEYSVGMSATCQGVEVLSGIVPLDTAAASQLHEGEFSIGKLAVKEHIALGGDATRQVAITAQGADLAALTRADEASDTDVVYIDAFLIRERDGRRLQLVEALEVCLDDRLWSSGWFDIEEVCFRCIVSSTLHSLARIQRDPQCQCPDEYQGLEFRFCERCLGCAVVHEVAPIAYYRFCQLDLELREAECCEHHDQEYLLHSLTVLPVFLRTSEQAGTDRYHTILIGPEIRLGIYLLNGAGTWRVRSGCSTSSMSHVLRGCGWRRLKLHAQC